MSSSLYIVSLPEIFIDFTETINVLLTTVDYIAVEVYCSRRKYGQWDVSTVKVKIFRTKKIIPTLSKSD